MSDRESSELTRLLAVAISALRGVADYADRNHCSHDETHRGGAIWEICDMCGAEWADDEGGKPDDAGKLPDVIERAYALLDKHGAE